MKQSTFSAFVANSIKNLLQGYTKSVRFLAVLILLLTLGIGQAWAYDFTQGTVVYFDNTLTQWSKVYLRVGKTDYNNAYQLTKVSGTQDLYKYTIPSWGGYAAFSFANSQGWTDNNTIYQPYNSGGIKPNGEYAITGQTEYFSWNLDKMRLFIPNSNKNKEHNCQYYNTDVEYNNYQRTVTIKSPTNGTIKVTYTDENNASQSKTSSNFKVAQTCIITVTATPNAGYELSSLTVGGSAFTSGNTYVVRGDIEITASFSAKKYTVTLNANGGTGGTASVTATYGQALPKVTDLPTREGYTFTGYFTANSGGTQYYNADGTSAKNWDKTSATTLYAQWTGNKYTITWVVDAVELTGAQLDGVTTIVNHGDKIATAPKVVVEDYCGDIFVGWTDAVGGEYVHGTSNLYTTDFPQITNNTTLYAVFADYKK